MKHYIKLSELQYFAKRDTTIVLNNGKIVVGFTSCQDANLYATQKSIIYKEIVNECIILKY